MGETLGGALHAAGRQFPDGAIADLRLRLLGNGYEPVPIIAPTEGVKSAGKRPRLDAWASMDITPPAVRAWSEDYPRDINTGLRCGQLVGIDIDVLDEALAGEVEQMALAMLGTTPLRRIGRAPKLLLAYRAGEAMAKSSTPEFILPCGGKAQIEILAKGQQFVSHGIHPETRQPYTWTEAAPEDTPLGDVPALAASRVRAFLAAASAVIREHGGRTRKEIETAEAPPRPHRPELPTSTTAGGFFREVNSRALADCDAWVRQVFPRARWQSNSASPPGAWRVSSEDLGRGLEEDISIHPIEGCQDFGTREAMTPIDLVMEHAGGTDAIKAALWLCEAMRVDPASLGWKGKAEAPARAASPSPTPARPMAEASAGGSVDFSDDAIASAFTDRHHAHLLYVPEWGHWLRWDGSRWAKDNTLAVFDLARAICREQAKAAQFESRAGSDKGLAIASAQKVAAVERMARSDRRHVREAALFDADPWALNTPGGVVDLRTGDLRPHQRSDHFTKVTTTAPAGDCPRWLRFLGEITQGDAAVVAYLQRWAGYILTGTTREHAFLVPHGPGGNGKGVMMNTLAGVMGDYATTAPMETFMASQHDRHPTDLAGLRGARLVVALETEAGRVLAEARIKALTGGDRISARFMRGDFFEFTPVFKLVMVGNHRPVIRNPDDAMRRRLHLLPLTFKPTKPDHTLPDQLKAEMPGILAWAVEGCLAWQREGLGMPEIVRDATADYFAEQDLLGQWLAERCKIEPGALTTSAALFRDWSAWTKDRGENPGTNKAFSAAMEQHHAKRRTREGAMFVGVRVLPSESGTW